MPLRSVNSLSEELKPVNGNQRYAWPYANEDGMRETMACDVLVLGGGLSGCFAAIAVIALAALASLRKRKRTAVLIRRI